MSANKQRATRLERWSILIYGVACYVLFLATFLYAIGFIGNFLTPTALDGAATVPFTKALLVNVGLLGLFALQHSVMARRGFKSWWTKIVPPAAERSTFVLASSLALALLFLFWQPMGGTVWKITHPVGVAVTYAGFAFGWTLVLVSTFLIHHFDLFGLRQVWYHFRGEPYLPLRFMTPALYTVVRHPLYVGWFFAFWFTPTMTTAHLVFSLATTAYILVAIRLEERDLVEAHGSAYEKYREEVPMLVPRLSKRDSESMAHAGGQRPL